MGAAFVFLQVGVMQLIPYPALSGLSVPPSPYHPTNIVPGSRQIHKIKWANVQRSFDRRLGADETGRVSPGRITTMVKRLLGWLRADVPFAGGFIAGFLIGFRYG